MQKDMYRVMRLVHDFLKDERQKQQMKLPSETYFLNEDEIVCFQRKRGDSRYPYTFDGLTLWAYSSGNVKIQESAFNILLGWENSDEAFRLPSNARAGKQAVFGKIKRG